MEVKITNLGVTIDDRLYRAGDTFDVTDEELIRLSAEIETLRRRAEGSMCELITQAAAPMRDYDDNASPEFLSVYGRHSVDMSELRVARTKFMTRVFDVYKQWVPIESVEGRIVIQRQTQNISTMRMMMATVLSSMPNSLVADVSFMLAMSHRMFEDAVVHQAADLDSPPYWMTASATTVSDRVMGLSSGPLIRIGRHYLPMRSGTVGGAVITKHGSDTLTIYPMAAILAGVAPKQRGTETTVIVCQTSTDDERATLSVMRCKSKMGISVAIDGTGGSAPSETADPTHPMLVAMAEISEKIMALVDVDGVNTSSEGKRDE